ncbi:G-type lectin S-receptor-like serine/threonine-protein kinase At1g67520 [Prosopis cineraria]|uniref:G-type lectin S-receptor-like serine/threonine-protein kinase At1g67520 n=1 Tax=Prosopis cineraria TaxID=364024 RepID=UPI0024100EB1|nr:G-type lectin S-receptor-like serine/threonine-protein kinase At1g67520 [Prosopis cineraria]
MLIGEVLSFDLVPDFILYSPTMIYKLHLVSYFDEYFLGITKPQQIFWIANRDDPLDLTKRPRLIIDEYGNNTIVYHLDPAITIPIYSFSTSNAQQIIRASLILKDNGFLQLVQKNETGPDTVLWDSFDHPNNVIPRGIRLGLDRVTGKKRNITSWASPGSPASGSFTLGMDVDNNTMQLVIWWQGSVYWKSWPMTQWHNRTTEAEGFRSHYYSRYSDLLFLNETNGREINVIFAGTLSGDNNNDNNTNFIGLNPRGELYGAVSVSCNGENPEHFAGCNPPKPPSCRHPHAYVSFVNNRTARMSEEGFRIENTQTLTVFWFFPLINQMLDLVEKRLRQAKLLHEIGDTAIPFTINGKRKSNESDKTGQEIHKFSFESIATATCNFLSTNKLGEGDFGPVYKDQAEDRPNMSEVVFFLSNDTILLVEPKQPVFFTTAAEKKTSLANNIKGQNCSIYDAIVSDIDGR